MSTRKKPTYAEPLAPISEEVLEALETPKEPLPLHKQLKAAREARGISLRSLWRMTSIHYSELHKIEKGIRNPTVRTVEKIGEALKFDLWLKLQ